MLDLMYKKQTNQLPSLIMKQLSKFGHSLNTRLKTSENYSIPHHFVKNNLIYDLLTAWNKTPKYIKTKILKAEEPLNNNFVSLNKKFKIYFKDYINTKYEYCSEKNCRSCSYSTYGKKKINGTIIPYLS